MTARRCNRWRWKMACCLSLLVLAGISQAAETTPAWRIQAQRDALRDGYRLIDRAELESNHAAFLILDVRPDYEFRQGHLPGAVNLEFDLADRLDLNADKRKALLQVLGPDKDRTIVVYCRSYT